MREMTTDANGTVRYRVTGMVCSGCAAKIGSAALSVADVREVSIASQDMVALDGRWGGSAN